MDDDKGPRMTRKRRHVAANKGRSAWQRRNGTASLFPAAIHLLMAV